MPEWLTKKAALRKYGPWLVGILVFTGLLVIMPDTKPPAPAPPPSSTTVTTTPAPPPSSTTVTTTPAPPPSCATPPPRPEAPLAEGTGVFQTPVAYIKPAPRCDDLIRRMWAADPTGELWVLHFGQLATHDYSVPVVDARTATTTKRVRRKWSFPGSWNFGDNERIGWNPLWRPSRGFDGYLVVYNPDTGEEWDFWNVSWGNPLTCPNGPSCYNGDQNWSTSCIHPNNFFVGFDIDRDVCAASANRILTPSGKVADMRTYTGNMPGPSGLGMPNLTGLLRAADVEAGHVGYAIKTMIPNSMFGPVCSEQDRTDPTKFGYTCGMSVSPAGKLETHKWPGDSPAIPGSTADEERANTVPDGTRFSLAITDAEIEAWLDERGYTGTLRRSVRTIVVGLRDYGWIISDTKDTAGVLFQADADIDRWRALGFTGDRLDLFHGLFTKDRIRAWEPAYSTCNGVKDYRWFCHAEAITAVPPR